jgi:hypothetical protein
VGTYNVSEIQVQDNSGNIHNYHPTDLGALGIASSFALTTAVPAAVMITSVTDDVPLLTGALSNGAHTNDPDLTVQVSLSGTGALAGDTVQLYNGTATGSPTRQFVHAH